MIYAQFFHEGEISKKLIPACGDRSVIIIDGRVNGVTKEEIARTTCKRRGYLAYQLYRGDTFCRSNPIGDIVTV